MDFSFSDEEEAVRELAGQIFEGQAGVERVKEVEGTDERFDGDLWAELAKANLLGLAVPEQHGGSGLGLIEACLVLEQQGRFVAPVPVWETAVAAMTLAEWGSDRQLARVLPGVATGEAVLTLGLAEPGGFDPWQPSVSAEADGDGWRLNGWKPSVPAAHVAHVALVPVATPEGSAVVLVDPEADGVSVEWAETTSRMVEPHLTFDGFRVGPEDVVAGPDRGHDAITWMLEHAHVGLCALAVGVCEEALARTAAYVSEREQFGRPLSTNQGVAMRAGDAYIDTEAMRATLWQAAWRLSEGREAAAEVAVAKWWAAEGAHRVVHATQHLHGGVGADVDYPIHRYFLWGKRVGDALGAGSWQLTRLGGLIAESAS